MARPAGHPINRAAWKDFLLIRETSLSEVAEQASIPRTSLSTLVGGFNRASVPMARRIAKALGCSTQTLFPSITAEESDGEQAA